MDDKRLKAIERAKARKGYEPNKAPQKPAGHIVKKGKRRTARHTIAGRFKRLY